MATGINEDKINSLKVELLNYTEQINSLSSRLDTCKTSISASIKGDGANEILSKLNTIIEQMPIVNQNINTYISDLSKVSKAYENQDVTLSKNLVQNISRLGE